MAEASQACAVRVGEVLADKYRIEKLLGAGGMGIVVAARHLRLDELVAIKFLLPEAATNLEAVSRFAREARAAVKIKNEHVARVTDVSQLDDGTPYMVMEYLDGRDLSTLLAQEGVLSPDRAVDFILQTCEAIAEAHELGIVHRDLKPSNLFCIRQKDDSIQIKVLDFGISKLSNTSNGEPLANMTQSTCVMGSPYYMSPEQLRSARDVDARSDIWSLGVILFEALTGRVPYRAASLPELYLSIVQQPTPSLRALRPELPEDFERIVQRCLAKSRDDRFTSIADLAVGLAPFADRRAKLSIERILGAAKSRELLSGTYTLPPSSEGGGVSIPPTESASWGGTIGPRNTRKTLIVTSSVVAAVGLASLLLVSVRRDKTNYAERAGASHETVAPSGAIATEKPSSLATTAPESRELTAESSGIASAKKLANMPPLEPTNLERNRGANARFTSIAKAALVAAPRTYTAPTASARVEHAEEPLPSRRALPANPRDVYNDMD